MQVYISHFRRNVQTTIRIQPEANDELVNGYRSIQVYECNPVVLDSAEYTARGFVALFTYKYSYANHIDLDEHNLKSAKTLYLRHNHQSPVSADVVI